MSFVELMSAASKGELLLIDGGMCHWHLCRNGQLTIREIISTKPGAGREMLYQLKLVPGATHILARCPVDYPANGWYERMGFTCTEQALTRTGKTMNVWRLEL